ncbi:sugar kinase [Microbacterium schleiferi]|uniref:Sugar kinase n=1 Tax=Microbacterium schleiferi TaxID=69362 RepID=A0A7S8RGJ8_9MICO|nr:sugar kinase [Microbacterium schleiferi]QPE03452.1 sugar kinase [Microbacterium schleiferi]
MSEREDRLDLVSVGETMGLFRAESIGPLSHSRQFHLGIGGAESNVAIGVARLGGHTGWVGRVGADGVGDLVLRELAAEGVRVHAVRDHGAPTGLMLKERRSSETQHVWYHRAHSAGAALRPEDLPRDAIAKARVLHVTGITPALSKTARATVEEAIALARSGGATVSFDVNHRRALWPSSSDAARALRTIAEAADIVFASDAEGELLTGENDARRQAERFAAWGAREAVIKRGSDGAALLADGRWLATPALSIQPLDTVGAGDAFVAGYLAELLEGRTFETRLHTAVRSGAFACLVPGDWEGMPGRAELELLDASDPVTR